MWTYGLYVNLEVDNPICGPLVLWSLVNIHFKLYVKSHSQYSIWMTNWDNISSKNIHEIILIRLFIYLKQCLAANKYKLHDKSVRMDFTSLSNKVLHDNKQFDYVTEKHRKGLENYFRSSLSQLNKILVSSDLHPIWKIFHDSNIQYNRTGVYYLAYTQVFEPSAQHIPINSITTSPVLDKRKVLQHPSNTV